MEKVKVRKGGKARQTLPHLDVKKEHKRGKVKHKKDLTSDK